MASSKSQSPTKRLLQELQAYQSDPNDALVQLGPVSDDELMHWAAVMKGVQGTAYEGGRWKLDIRIPSNYPLAPPEIKFITPICHPNVNFKVSPSPVPSLLLSSPNNPISDRRDLPRPAQNQLEPRLHNFDDLDLHQPAPDVRGARLAAEYRYCAAVSPGGLCRGGGVD